LLLEDMRRTMEKEGGSPATCKAHLPAAFKAMS